MLAVHAGATSLIIPLAIRNALSGSGGYLTGLTSSSVLISYSRPDQGNAAATTVSLSGGTRGTWSSGGFVEKDSTNDPGTYEFGVPNAAIAAGASWVVISLIDAGSNNVVPLKFLIVLDPPANMMQVNSSNTVETGITPLQAFQYMAAALAGTLSGAGGTSITIGAINNGSTTRITATVDSSGDRTAVTLS